MSNLKKSKAWNVVKWIVLLVCLVAIFSSIGIVVSRLNKVDTTRDLTIVDYSVGSLASTKSGDTLIGDEISSEYAIRTGYIEVSKFNKITVNNGNTLTYSIYLYDSNKSCLNEEAPTAQKENMTALSTTDYSTAKYFRLVLTSTTDTVNVLTENDFVKQITVTVNR